MTNVGDRTTRVGPFLFTWQPDPEDPGTGSLRVDTDSGYWAGTQLGVTRDEWDEFLKMKARDGMARLPIRNLQ